MLSWAFRAVSILVAVTLALGAFIGLYTALPVHAQNLTDAQRAKLEAELVELEKRIAEQQELLKNKQGERVTLERDIAILEGQIKKAKLTIRARDIQIGNLTGEIGDRNKTIDELVAKMEREKESLAQILRNTDEIDNISMVEIVLGNQTLSDFFEELDDFQAVKAALHQSFGVIENTKGTTEAEKLTLEEKRKQEQELKRLQQLEQQKIEADQSKKGEILDVTKGQEANYQQLIAQGQKSVAEIRAALFELRGAAAIPFGEAYDYAKAAERITGVRAAVTLGVLKQETRMGEFLGTGNWQTDMHPTRDRPLFKVIAETVGFNPDSVPVSAQPGYGWGGAMGPGQFIPSTWSCYGGYVNTVTGDCGNTARSLDWDAFWAGPWKYDAGSDRIRVMLGGSSPSSPYRPRDAITATAVLMKDNGADRGGFENERLAALRYFAGWGNASNPSYAFYGDSVMEHATGFQAQIDILEKQ